MASAKCEQSDRLEERGRIKPWCPITVEPLLTVFVTGLMASGLVSQQYVYNVVGNGTLPTNSSNCDINITDPAYQKQLEAQAETSQWTLYVTLASAIPGVVFTVMLGTVSDAFGRKVMLIVPAIGGLLGQLITALIIHFSLPLEVWLAGNFLFGMMGGWTAMLGGCFAYIADVTDPGKQRTFRLALLQSTIGVSSIVAEIGAGYWLRGRGIPRGFQEISWSIVGLSVFCCLYPFSLRETISNVNRSTLLSCGHFRSFFNVFNEKRYEGRRRKLLLGILAYLLSLGGSITASSLLVVYVLGPPFCFTANLVGLLKAASNGTFLTSLLWIRLLNQCMSEFAIVMIGFLSFVAGMILLAFAGDFSNPELAVFMVPVVFMFKAMVPPLLKSLLSREVRQDEQGTLFAVLLSTDSVGDVIFSLLLNNIYSSTVGFMRGLVFLLAAGIILIAAVLVGVMHCCGPTHEYKPLPGMRGDTRETIND